MNEERRSLHAAFSGKEELFSRTIRALSLAENHSSPRQESPSALSTLTLPRMRMT